MSLVLSQIPKEKSGNSVLLVLPDRQVRSQDAERLVGELKHDFTNVVLSTDLPSGDSILSFCEELEEALIREKIKRVTVLGIGPGASIAQALAVSAPKIIRRAIVCNATTRMAPSLGSIIVDRMEKFLPLGLPLRNLSADFDSRPFLHRIHCPVLVLYSKSQRTFVKEQGDFIVERIPNAWIDILEREPINEFGQFSDALLEHIRAFMQVPTKRPQKNA